jgi:hypothetical protein
MSGQGKRKRRNRAGMRIDEEAGQGEGKRREEAGQGEE